MDISKLDRKLHAFPLASSGAIMESLGGICKQK